MSADWVEVRSDHDYIGRPLAFLWKGTHYDVAEVLSQIRTPSGFHFRVRTPDAGIFELDYDTDTDQWSVHQL